LGLTHLLFLRNKKKLRGLSGARAHGSRRSRSSSCSWLCTITTAAAAAAAAAGGLGFRQHVPPRARRPANAARHALINEHSSILAE